MDRSAHHLGSRGRRLVAPAVGILQTATFAMLLLGCVALGVAAIRVLRLEPFFVIAVALWAPQRTWPRSSPLLWVEAAAAVAVFAAALAFGAPQLSCLAIRGEWAPDVTVDVRGRGTLLVPFGWGHYAIWRFTPQFRVSIDGRRETCTATMSSMTRGA
jgi:hypothetical protein